MKITKLLSLVIVSAFVLSSCSSNENLLPEAEKTNSLKSYKVKRDASGAYSIDYDLEENVKSEKVTNSVTNTNEFHLYQSDYTTSKRQSEELFIDGNELSIGFIDTRTNKKANITIEDDNIAILKTSSVNSKMLSEYSFSSNTDGTINLDFKVNNKVSVDFVYNEEINTYEIHLEEGKSSETNFSRSLTRVNGQVLKIDFVNHLDKGDSSLKGVAARELIRRKPRIAIDNGESGENL
ncbi:hypothetical protein CW731_13670 [Polaribacter sp. ALD11]|uniref:hypothetical protein n=1 Tax=Polaribacter sp. ALD11 TaxID=2058137 RepID=UPI000C30DBBE|nr:hypothetical protein [Polaribacter sp. ALD11]AUC86261.1 hypothetical protein CW731_13670 [Polaribacter sp. ALD11]